MYLHQHVYSDILLTLVLHIHSCHGYDNFTLLWPSLPEIYSIHAVGIYNDTLTLISGQSSSGNLRTYGHSASLHPYSGSWSKVSFSNPTGIETISIRQNFVQIGHFIYIINPQQPSEGTQKWVKRMFIYNLKTDEYSIGIAPPTDGYHGCAVYDDDNLIYQMGGYSSANPVYHLFVYDIQYTVWSTKASLIEAKYLNGCAMDISKQYIYDFGGKGSSNDGGSVNTIQKYVVSDDDWSLLSATLSRTRYAMPCILFPVDECIYCVSGLGSGTNDVDVFDPLTETIVRTIYINIKRRYFPAILYQNCIIITGGSDLSSIEYFGDCVGLTREPTLYPTTYIPTTSIPTTSIPTTSNPTTFIPTTYVPTISIPTTSKPTTYIPTTSKPTEITCGDEMTGDYKGEYMIFTLQMTTAGNVQFDARLSELDILYLRGFNSAGEMIQNDLDHDKQLILRDVTSGVYHFEIHAKSGSNGMYNVKLMCTFDEQRVIETLATNVTLNTMEYKGNEDYSIPLLLSTLLLILICCGKCVMYFVYKKWFQKDEKQKPNRMMEMSQPQHIYASNDNENAVNESLVSVWLTDLTESVHLAQYISLFTENGFDSMKSLKNIDEKQLYEIGIMNKEHQRLIMREIKKLSKCDVVDHDPVFEDAFVEPQNAQINVYDGEHPSQPQLTLQNTKRPYGAIDEESDDIVPETIPELPSERVSGPVGEDGMDGEDDYDDMYAVPHKKNTVGGDVNDESTKAYKLSKKDEEDIQPTIYLGEMNEDEIDDLEKKIITIK